MAEAYIEKYLRTSVLKRGGLCLKLIIMGKRNFPDRTILAPGGKIFFVELKDIGKHPTKTQGWFHRLLKRLGFTIYVCKTKSHVNAVLDAEMEAPALPEKDS